MGLTKMMFYLSHKKNKFSFLRQKLIQLCTQNQYQDLILKITI